MNYCCNRVMKPLPTTYDKTSLYLNCHKQLNESLECPLHGKDINDPGHTLGKEDDPESIQCNQ